MEIKAGVKRAGKEIAAGITVAITIELLRTLTEVVRKAGRRLRRRNGSGGKKA